MRATAITFVLLFACTTHPAVEDDPPGADDMGSGSGSDSEVDPCASPVAVPLAGRSLDLMPPARLAEFAARMPCLASGPVRTAVERHWKIIALLPIDGRRPAHDDAGRGVTAEHGLARPLAGRV